uniref:baeRF12 domain-containing protein n=1 Tax=Altererythrobacter segetis TaxID=1104773 RepID=UPI00140DE88D|nr:host attachment protein [Altererythrobacter segetis]
MKVPHNAHVAVVDGERFRLMRNIGPIFEPKLELVAEPSFRLPVPGAESRSDDRGTLTTAGSETDLREVVHGAAVVEWLNAKALAGEIDQLVVVADPRTLGEMRPRYHKALQGKIVAELPKELTSESPQAIAQTLAAA